MKNILSYQLGTIFTGKEIKDWIIYHTQKETSSHAKEAWELAKYLNIRDNKLYRFLKGTYRSSASYGKYLIRGVDKG
jgi:hypothetical protein